tara:strand:+ start:11840 stop:12481 length:642 start_codon:yes stop_codon:yes gene_type:complete
MGNCLKNQSIDDIVDFNNEHDDGIVNLNDINIIYEDDSINNNLKILQNLNENDLKNIDIFSLEGIETYIRVKSIYDGDTITIIIVLNNEPIAFKCRLSGIDTPEKRPRKNQIDRDREKFYAQISTDYLKTEIMQKILKAKLGKFDKYGRLLIEIFDNDNISINDKMINKMYAIGYDGKTKSKFDWDTMDKVHGYNTNVKNIRESIIEEKGLYK